LALAASSSACTAESNPQQAANEQTATTDQALITTTGNIMAWPLAPVTWDGLNATWPIAVWSPNLIGGLAFDVAGMTGLGITVAGYPNLLPITISSAYLNAFIPTAGLGGVAGTPFFGAGGLYAPAYGFDGLYAPYAGLGYGYGAYTGTAALQSTWLNGALMPGWTGLWTPALTSSALMFTNLATLSTFMPYTFNITFAAQTAAQQTALAAQTAAFSTAALSVFATPILPGALAAQTAAIPFMSMVWPIMPLSPALLGAPLATGALL
jgi:hypothetical protein